MKTLHSASQHIKECCITKSVVRPQTPAVHYDSFLFGLNSHVGSWNPIPGSVVHRWNLPKYMMNETQLNIMVWDMIQKLLMDIFLKSTWNGVAWNISVIRCCA